MSLNPEDPVIKIAKRLVLERQSLANDIKKDLNRLKLTVNPDPRDGPVWTAFSPWELMRLTKSLHGKDRGKYNKFVEETIKEIHDITKKAFENIGQDSTDETVTRFLEQGSS